MQGRTHNMVGIACAMGTAGIIMEGNVSLPVMVTSIVAGGLGGLAADIDEKKSLGRKYISKLASTLLFIAVFFYMCKDKIDLKQFQPIYEHINYTRLLIGGLLLSIIYVYGMHTPHRTFMHSITICIASSICVFIALPSFALYYAVGYGSHLLIDLFNRKKEQLLWPLKIGKICFNLCDADGIVNDIIFFMATVGVCIMLVKYI